MEKIKGLLTKYMEINKSVRFEIEYFTDSTKMYHQIRGESWSDIYILDMIRPIREELFIEALDYAAASFSKIKRDAIYTVKTKEGLTAISYSKIEYIYNYSRTLNTCLTDGKSVQSIFIRKSFDEETRQIVESGARIPVSKARTADVKKEFQNNIDRRQAENVL